MVDSIKSSIKAVAFAFMSPEVVLLIADKTTYCLHFYPSKSDGKVLDLSDTGRPHWVLLKSPAHIGAMAGYANDIDRLIVFGSPDELLGLGLPILDADVKGNNVEANRRHNRDEVLARINNDAVDLVIEATEKAYMSLKRQEQDKMDKKPSGLTFFQQLKDLKAMVNKDDAKLFVSKVGVPSVLRIMGDTDRDAFKLVCKMMVDKKWVTDEAARRFYRWVESFEGEGVELGKAVDALLYPKQEATERMRLESEWNDDLVGTISRRFGVDEGDLMFVARSYAQLIEEKKKEEVTSKKRAAAEEDEGGFPESVDDEPEEAVEQEEAEVGGDETEQRYPGEDDLEGSAFGWSNEEDGEKKSEDDEQEATVPQRGEEHDSIFDSDFEEFNS